jgi:pyruvate dehydrogenase E1 component alpha subunit
MLTEELEKKIFQRASVCRAFEEEVYRQVENGGIKIPVYLSAGQEYISSTISVYLESLGILDRQIFIQHRGHSTYLSFGGDMDELILELMGDKRGCSAGMGGSASIQSKAKRIYGHDGLMGSHGPIATGMAFGNKKFTLCFAGDAAAEEDYFLASLGWASTKCLPIWYVVEDNNLSILTEKKVRRKWEMSDVAAGFGMTACEVSDEPSELWEALEKLRTDAPCLLNVKTTRLFWHAGAGIDDPHLPDKKTRFTEKWGEKVVLDAEKEVREAWTRCLNP